jgi:hypothetical protein
MSWRNVSLSMIYTGSQKLKGSIEIILAYVGEDIFRLRADLFVCTQDDNEEPRRQDHDSCAGNNERKPTVCTKCQHAGCAIRPHRIPNNLHELKMQSMLRQRGRWSERGVRPMKRKDR